MIVSTGKLRKKIWLTLGGSLENSRGYLFVCCGKLKKFFNVPESGAYWLEVSDERQRGRWVVGEVKVAADGIVVWRVSGGHWGDMYWAAQRFLRRHFKLSEKPKRLWCRLVYE